MFRTVPQDFLRQKKETYGMNRLLVIAALLLMGCDSDPVRMYTPDRVGVRDVPADSVAAAEKEGYRRVPTVMIRTQAGDVIEVDEDLVGYEIDKGAWRLTSDEVQAERESKAAGRRWMTIAIVGPLIGLALWAIGRVLTRKRFRK